MLPAYRMAHVLKEKNTVEREKIVKRGVTVGKEKGDQREKMVGGEAQSGKKDGIYKENITREGH